MVSSATVQLALSATLSTSITRGIPIAHQAQPSGVQSNCGPIQTCWTLAPPSLPSPVSYDICILIMDLTMTDMSQKTQQAMDAVLAGAAEAGRYSRRIVTRLWDPKPANDRQLNSPVWCLGCQYANEPNSGEASTAAASATSPTTPCVTAQPPPSATVADTPPASSSSSFSSSLVYDEPAEDGGWPPAFLDDFESRPWMTYRSGFEPIARSTDPRASAALSLAMRLKTLTDQAGFSSDTGWGCMIRSGQSLLANALSLCQLGRGMAPFDNLSLSLSIYIYI